jgi:hypothetical protein
VGQRPCCFEYRLHCPLEFRPSRACRHRPDQAYALGNSPKFLTVASRHANSCVYQFVAENGRDLHRQPVFGFAQVGPDEDLKMPILAALIIPALAYAPAAPAADVNPIAIRN